MQRSHSRGGSSRLTPALALALLVAAGAGCSGAPSSSAGRDGGAPSPAAGGADSAPTTLPAARLGLPYQPNVQFAPLYLAEDRGYFRDEGLDLVLEYGSESDQIRLVGDGQREAMIAGGDQVILARAAGVPVKYIATWFQRFPSAVFSLDPALTSPADLVGKTVGLPDAGGTSMLAWQVLLLGNGIAPESVPTQVIGFTQLASVLDGRVQAAMGYANNEPLQLAAMGRTPVVIEVADTANLVSNGLVMGDTLIAERPELAQGLVNGLLRGIAATLADPDAAFDAALRRIPEMADPAAKDTQRQVLAASLRLWSAPKLGEIDPAQWRESQDYMRRLGLIAATSPIEDLIEPRFAAAAETAP